MDTHNWQVEQFEAARPHLRAVAYRMLGSLTEAEDAVQESWLHLSRSDTSGVESLGGWLTTVVARICLDMLRSRKAQREEPLESESITNQPGGIDPEEEALLADSVGLALLVVLNTLNPAERLAFVLHDIFAMPFDEIAPIVERSESAARQLASRARRRVRGAATEQDSDLTSHRAVVDAFLTASRSGNFDALLSLLAPDVVFRHDITAVPAGAAREIHGADSVARQFSGRAQGVRSALINGSAAAIVTRRNELLLVLNLTIIDEQIVEINVILNPEQLRQLKWRPWTTDEPAHGQIPD